MNDAYLSNEFVFNNKLEIFFPPLQECPQFSNNDNGLISTTSINK